MIFYRIMWVRGTLCWCCLKGNCKKKQKNKKELLVIVVLILNMVSHHLTFLFIYSLVVMKQSFTLTEEIQQQLRQQHEANKQQLRQQHEANKQQLRQQHDTNNILFLCLFFV